jgi:hypothetical protein
MGATSSSQGSNELLESFCGGLSDGSEILDHILDEEFVQKLLVDNSESDRVLCEIPIEDKRQLWSRVNERNLCLDAGVSPSGPGSVVDQAMLELGAVCSDNFDTFRSSSRYSSALNTVYRHIRHHLETSPITSTLKLEDFESTRWPAEYNSSHQVIIE